MPPALTFCAEPDVLRGRVQPMLPNRPPLSVEISITAEPPRFPVHQCVHK
jgi:hypothetical protein